MQADASPLSPTYRVSPATLATILDAVATLLGVSAVGLAAWEFELLRRRRRAPDPPLVRALRRGELQSQATRLAWSEPTPEPAEVELLVQAIERQDTA